MTISTVTTYGTDAWLAFELASAAISQQDFLAAIRSSVKDAQPV
jgi:hypothetical protein